MSNKVKDIKTLVYDSLFNAHISGYDFKGYSIKEVADDLFVYNSVFENIPVESIIPHVESWFSDRSINLNDYK